LQLAQGHTLVECVDHGPLHILSRRLVNARDVARQVIHQPAHVRIAKIPGNIDAELVDHLSEHRLAVQDLDTIQGHHELGFLIPTEGRSARVMRFAIAVGSARGS
jgi:hypothetical protein